MSSYNPPEGERLQPRPSGIQRLDSSTPPPPPDESASASGGGSGEPPPSDHKPSGSSSKLLVRLLVVVLLAVGGWYYFGHSDRAGAISEEQSPMYQKQKVGPSAQPASLSAADVDKVRGDRAREAAMRGDPIPFLANPSPEFLQNVKDGKVQFYAVRLYDTCYEDGDVVTLRLSSGVEIGPVPLTNAGTTVSFPVVASDAPQVTIIGIKDGTGGITVGVQTSGGMWYSGVIPERGTETMPLTVR